MGGSIECRSGKLLQHVITDFDNNLLQEKRRGPQRERSSWGGFAS